MDRERLKGNLDLLVSAWAPAGIRRRCVAAALGWSS
jgi:hypothetical protein